MVRIFSCHTIHHTYTEVEVEIQEVAVYERTEARMSMDEGQCTHTHLPAWGLKKHRGHFTELLKQFLKDLMKLDYHITSES